MKNLKTLLFICLAALAVTGCKKGFLDAKPNKSLLIPTTLADMQALLDNIAVFNLTPSIGVIADGDFYSTDAAWKTWNLDAERNAYSWNQEIWETFDPPDWKIPYQQVFYANVVLDGLAGIAPTSAGYGAVKGNALFSRGFAYYNLLQAFTLPYQAATASGDLGLSIRLTADVTQNPPRASLQATYDQVVTDLKAARYLLLPTSTNKSRPTLAADYNLLAKVYLQMGDYTQAGKYADSCLQQISVLIDYNTLNAAAAKPFPRAIPYGNDELIYYASEGSYSFISNAATLADSLVYRSYAANDLRKGVFYKAVTAGASSAAFKGNYAGIIALFSGLATDEMYLVRAECAARAGQAAAAMGDLNTLLVKRWKTGTFVPFSAADPQAALALVLAERRKELIGRGLRWADLKRLNNDPRFAVTLTRTVNGVKYTLAPGSKRYAFPLPLDEVSQSGAVQNER